MRFLRALLLGLICSFAISASAQLTIGTVDPGPYTPGSSIAATFTITPGTCIPIGNTFNMYLSDQNGSFAAPRLIGSYAGFYSTFVNGTIPNIPAIVPGVGYKVRIQAGANASLIAESGAFAIVAGPPVVAAISSSEVLPGFPDTFGFCAGRDNYQFAFENQSTAGSVVSSFIQNELNGGAPTAMVFTPQFATFTAGLAHYTIFTKAVNNGTVGTRANFIVNNITANAFNTGNGAAVCLPSNPLMFSVDITSSGGIQKNFPGNTYTIDWGDQVISTYTICDIQQNGGTVRHTYTRTSCGSSATVGNTTYQNAFPISVNAVSPFCGRIGLPLATFARAILGPQNSFTGPAGGIACTGSTVTFVNTSTSGENPSTTSPGCIPNDIRYNWYVDNQPVALNQLRSYNLVHIFNTPGPHVIRLRSVFNGECNDLDEELTICVQNPPQPSFTITPTTICTGTILTPTNTSQSNATCSSAVNYTWIITPATGVSYVNNTTANSQTPNIQFNSPGIYDISLIMATQSCSAVVTTPQRVTVNTSPQATLSNDFDVCLLGTYNFNTTPSPTRATVAGTTTSLADTYTWTVTPANGGAFNFAGTTNSSSRYPSITFSSFDQYTVTVVHQNNCGTATDSQVITFIQSPVPTVTASANPICRDAIASLTGAISGTYTSFQWINSLNTTVGFSDPNNLVTTYTPTTAERNAGVANVRLRVNTGLTGTCAIVDELFSINIYPANTGTNTTQSICTGDFATYTPTSSVAGSTFTWTAANADGNAIDFSASGSGAINDDINNTSPTAPAVVVYTITPTSNGCTGTPFTFTVTVNPRPIAAATAASPTICSGQGAGITLSSNLAGTSYTWTSTAVGATGNTNNAIPTANTSINQTLTNTGTTPGTVTYTVTPITNGCSGQPITISLTVNPQPTIANAGQDRNLCAQSSYTLEGNTVLVGTGIWTQTTPFPGVTFTNDTNPTSAVNGLQAGNTYIFRWTITGGTNCGSNFDEVSITVSPTSVGGTTSGDQSVCAGGNAGQITLSGHTGNIIRWESSTDGVSWTPISNTTTTLNYLNLTVTTQYRAVVQSGSCASSNSTISIVTVNQQVTIADAGPDQVLCNVTSTTLAGNSPGSNSGMWSVVPTTPGVTFGSASSPSTTVSGLIPGQIYTFRWTISGSPSCSPSINDVTVQIDLPSNGGTTAGSDNVCAGANGGSITLSGQVGNILRWESSTDNFNTISNIASTQTSINYANLTTTTSYRAVVQNGVCGSAFSSIATITVNQGVGAASAGPDQVLCNQTSVLLAGNSPGTNTGTWSVVPNNPAITFNNPSLPNATASGLLPGQTYTFRWTISGSPSCPSSPDEVIITNLTAIANNTISSTATTYCSGQPVTITGSVPTGGNGTYSYVWESSPTGAAPWTLLPVTSRDLSVTASSNVSFRRTVNSPTCSSFSNIWTITTLPPIANNTITGSPAICLGSTASPIIGSVPTGGDGTNYTYGWEQSVDGGTTWSLILGASGKDYAPGAITQTTAYRRLVSSGVCTTAPPSAPITITVNLNARAEYTYTQDVGCAPFIINASNIRATAAAQNGTYEWFANGVSIGTGIVFPGYPITGYNQTVTILLRVTSNNGCAPQDFSHDFRTRENIVSQFTQDRTSGCGPLSVTFNNTTVHDPANVYSWSIDGTFISNARDFGTRTFASGNQGIDRQYDITLRVISACGDNSVTHSVIVNSMPIPAISPVVDRGCSSFLAEFINTTPGKETNTYTVNFGDGSAPQSYNWGDPITHLYTTTVATDFPVTITATNACGSLTSSPVFVRVTPNTITPIFFAPPAQQTICAGTEVIFTNNSAGATRFTYEFRDGSQPVQSFTGLPETVRHVFTQPGTYDVLMTAYNDCSSPRTATQTITVLARPTVTFTANATTGCQGLTVVFTQTSTGAIRYDWDFGDGIGTSTDPNPTYTYNSPPGQYTVTLTVTNQLNCTQTATRINYITIVGPPIVDFAVSPASVISIPDYTFRFTNESTNGAQTYRWDFGDGVSSTQRDPTHSYTDTGRYQVTLTAYNEYGCFASTNKTVQILGVPGYTFVPNSFIPGSTSLPLQKFMAVGSGMKSWKMQIFNKWGQILWETTKLEDGKPVEGWDGTFKGVPQPQGIYFWKIDVELINGSEWKGMSLGKGPPKRTGEIYLIR